MFMLAAPAYGDWEIVEKPGKLRVANSKIAVELTSVPNQATVITALAAEKSAAMISVVK